MAKNRVKKKKMVRSHNQKKRALAAAKKAVVRESWVDRLRFVPVVGEEGKKDVASVASEPQTELSKRTYAVTDDDDDEDEDSSTSTEPLDNEEPPQQNVSIICWNVLADSYCSPRSHRKLPPSYTKVVFTPRRRKKRILQILHHMCEQLQVGLVCLQEVDMDEIAKELQAMGYQGVETPRVASGGATGGKIDSCVVYARSDSYQIQDYQLLRLDDLATHSNNNSSSSSSSSQDRTQSSNDNNIEIPSADKSKSLSIPPVNSNWQGLQHSFLRRNAAILVRLKHIATGNTLVVANAHLYWNPGYEYVKLCQAHYILTQARQFTKAGETLLMAGDLNSKPRGCTHSYLTNARINAKLVAPWYAYHHYNIDADFDYTPQTMRHLDGGAANEENIVTDGEDMDDDDDDIGNIVIHLANQMSGIGLSDGERPLGPVRYILDATLNKLCRWFRIMGIDAALETEEEEQCRTGNGNLIIFDRCRNEKRTLITSSTRLMARQNCPPGSYCINPVFLAHLEVAMVHVLLTHGYELDPDQFLSRCVVCNGDIGPIAEREQKCQILASYEAPTDRVDEMEVYQCGNCQQGYWWDDRPTSSASRVKSAATNLLVKCLQAGVPLKKDYKMGMFENLVNVEEEQKRGWDFTAKGSDLLLQQLNVVDWLKDDNLACPFSLRSAYACDDDHTAERIPFSNVTHDFVSTLDYIFFEPTELELNSRLYVPASFAELNDQEIDRGHLLPSDVWPSDHLAIGAAFSFFSPSNNTTTTTNGEGESKVSSPNQTVNGNQSQKADSLDNTTNGEGESKVSSPNQTASGNQSQKADSSDGLELACLPVGSENGPPLPPSITSVPERGAPPCLCGCVPNIPSLFEMAEKRKRLKEMKEQTKSSLE